MRKTSLITLVLAFIWSLMLWAQDSLESNTFEYTKKIRYELETIKDIKPSDYFKDIDNYRSSIEKYIEHKKRVCNGEFSTVILGAEAKSRQKKSRNKLSPEEKKLCFRELKGLQVTLVNNMFLARKKYLNYLHELRLEELADARDKVIKSLNNSFSKSRRRQ